ncbi:MAG TPA: IPT/TIG domain-containing protein [Chitinophagaceae bacterium]|nr:IPT/TIG domain-containing protein [Chitinophagaceae bacterium]
MNKTAYYMLLIILTASCNRRILPDSISLSQSSARPGETILINTGKRTISDKNKISVTFNEITSQVISLEDSLVEVMVPELQPGEAKINISVDKKSIGNSSITIKEHSTRKLIFMINPEGKVEKIGEKLSNDEIASPDLTAGNKIAYDLVDANQQILASGLVPNPLGGMEVFDDPQKKIFREKAGHMGGTFTINVPNIKGGMKLRIYDVQLPGDANNQQFLERKKLITEIDITAQ